MADAAAADLLRMQQEALQRVRRQDERARQALSGSPPPPVFEPPAAAVPSAPPPAPVVPTADRDTGLLLALLLVLGRERADPLLLLALLYIML